MKIVVTGRYPLAADEIALRNYRSRLAFDEEIRAADPRYANLELDDMLNPADRAQYAHAEGDIATPATGDVTYLPAAKITASAL